MQQKILITIIALSYLMSNCVLNIYNVTSLEVYLYQER